MTSEMIPGEEAVVTSILNKKFLIAGIVLVAFIGSASGYYYDNSDIGGISAGNLGIPEYDSNREILTEFVAPFIFVYMLLYFGLTKALHFTLRDNDRGWRGNEPNVSKEAAIMATAVTLMLIVTPFWNQIRLAMRGLGLVTVGAFIVGFFYVLYLMAR